MQGLNLLAKPPLNPALEEGWDSRDRIDKTASVVVPALSSGSGSGAYTRDSIEAFGFLGSGFQGRGNQSA